MPLGHLNIRYNEQFSLEVKLRIWNGAEDKGMGARVDLIGRTVGYLRIVRGYGANESGKARILECQCTKCGRERPAYFTRDQLLHGSVSRCFDCMEKPKPKPKSVLVSDSPDWRLYQSLRGRCDNPHHPKYPRFGAEGVQFAFASFQEFKNIVGERPTKGAQLKRIRETGDYAPGNVVWREPVAA